ncbi:hypothetical protein ACFOUV_17070 [Oceanobacillus longus]|uniref:Uncharacterized protein n=1 Tax=Oceanobacillus longus TaxID=930120 RepID=A0ABV8H3T1_9BACI
MDFLFWVFLIAVLFIGVGSSIRFTKKQTTKLTSQSDEIIKSRIESLEKQKIAIQDISETQKEILHELKGIHKKLDRKD